MDNEHYTDSRTARWMTIIHPASHHLLLAMEA